MAAGLIESDEHLYQLLARVKRACIKAGPGVVMEEFIIMRSLPGNRPPFVQLIQGVMPEGFNPFGNNRTNKRRSRDKTSTRKRGNKKGRIAP